MKKSVFLLTILVALTGVWGVAGLFDAETAVAAPASQPFFPDPQESAVQAANWLIAVHQNEDGGYSSFSGGAGLAPSDVGGTLDAMLAIASAGVSLDDSLAYLNENIADVAAYASGDGASAGKLVWALAAAGQDPRDFGGEDFVAALNGHLQADGSYNAPHPFGQSLAMYALAFVGEPVPDEAVAWLNNVQSAEEGLDGSWDDGFGTLGNADATAMAVMALSAAGVPADDDSLSRAIDFLTAVQLETGGWEYSPGFGQNGNSTALVIQALSVLGFDFVSADSPFARDGVTPLDALLTYQGETGAFQADFGDGPFDDFFTTVQSVPAVALAGAPVPVLISEPVEELAAEATAEPMEEPTAEPMKEPTAAPIEEPTEVPPTAVPAPTDAPAVEEPAAPAPELISEPTETASPAAEPVSSVAPILLVVLALALAGGAYWYLKN